MRLYLLALNPTASVTEGFLPAAGRLGLDVTVLTEPGYEAAHHAACARAAGPGAVPRVLGCRVRDAAEVVAAVGADAGRGADFALFSNSDHLQTQTALAAAYFGLPGKDWRAALRVKNKAQMRRHLAAARTLPGPRSAAPPTAPARRASARPAASAPAQPTAAAPDVPPAAPDVPPAAPDVPPAAPDVPPAAPDVPPVRAAELGPGEDLARFAGSHGVPYPCVVKPREGVASEDVVLAGDEAALRGAAARIRERRPGAALVVEEFLRGELHTLETLGDGHGTLHVLGGFRTELSAPPHFVEERLTFEPDAAGRPYAAQVLGLLAVLGVGFGACHTEFVVGEDGRARIVEVNYRAIGDDGDLLLAEVLDVPLFDHVLRTHLGVPLPAALGARADGRARQECPRADRAGTLTAAPGPVERRVDGVRLAYRPVRAVGERHELYHTNRDYLGIVRASGTDQAAVDRAVDGFLAAQCWQITP